MHSHHSSVCARQYLYVTFVWAYGCIFAANSSICSSLMPMLIHRFFFFNIFSYACACFDSAFHACEFLNEILQPFFILTYAFIFLCIRLFFCIIVLAHVIIFAMGSFSRAHNYWHIYWYNKISVRYIDQTLFCALFFLNALWEWENTGFWTKYPNTIWNIENEAV